MVRLQALLLPMGGRQHAVAAGDIAVSCPTPDRAQGANRLGALLRTRGSGTANPKRQRQVKEKAKSEGLRIYMKYFHCLIYLYCIESTDAIIYLTC